MPLSASQDRSRGSAAAVAVVFASAGFVMAQTLARVPALRDQVGASQAELGLALVGGGLGSLLAMPFAARLVRRFGNRSVTATAVVLGSLGWGSLALAGDVRVLFVLFVLAGAAVGVWDVSMNIQGYAVEQRRGRSLMPVLHASFSAGAVVGAGAGALAAWLGVGLQQVIAGALVALATGVLGSRRFVPAEDADPGTSRDGAGDGRRRGITRAEVLIGVVCLGAALAEGAANDWLALLLVDVRNAPEAFGALTFTAFNVTMLVGRLSGAPAIDRYGRTAVVRTGGVLAVTGILLVTLVPSLVVALAGGLLWGLGVATVFPAAMSAAGDVPGRGAAAIGVVSTISYGAFLFGAPTIGLLAESHGLDRALWLVVAFLVLMVLLAGRLREPTRSAGEPLGEVEDPVGS